MAKKKSKLFLVCSKCSHQNYRTAKTKNMQSQSLKLSLRKYCNSCQITQTHQEKIIK